MIEPVILSERPLIRAYLGDCMDFMADKKADEYDLAITDPPYNVGRKYNTHDDNMTDYIEWCDLWFSELSRVSKTTVMTVGYKNLKQWFNLDPRHMIIWNKPNQNSPSPLGGFNAYEAVLYWGKLHKRIGHDVFTKNISMQDDAKFHNCPKHLPSWNKLIDMVISPPAKLIDPFGGSFTSALSAYYFGFDLDIVELDEDYFNEAVKRFKLNTAQESLF